MRMEAEKTELSGRLFKIAEWIHSEMETPDKFSDVHKLIKEKYYEATQEQKQNMMDQWDKIGL